MTHCSNSGIVKKMYTKFFRFKNITNNNCQTELLETQCEHKIYSLLLFLYHFFIKSKKFEIIFFIKEMKKNNYYNKEKP